MCLCCPQKSMARRIDYIREKLFSHCCCRVGGGGAAVKAEAAISRDTQLPSHYSAGPPSFGQKDSFVSPQTSLRESAVELKLRKMDRTRDFWRYATNSSCRRRGFFLFLVILACHRVEAIGDDDDADVVQLLAMSSEERNWLLPTSNFSPPPPPPPPCLQLRQKMNRVVWLVERASSIRASPVSNKAKAARRRERQRR